MDPEDIREIIRSYHSRVAETACRHNGLVAHTYGNTAVLCFGYPEAHEDDPERAVRAALELVAAVAALKPPTPLQTRVGIATGLVVVGEMTDGRRAPARHHRRDAEHRRATPGSRRAEYRGYRRQYAKAPWQSVRPPGFRDEGPEGNCRSRARLGSIATELGRKPF